MHCQKIICIIISLLSCLGASAREDTLFSSTNDRVVIRYDVEQQGRKTVIRFSDAKKKLGPAFRDKYKSPEKLTVVFFDKTGGYEDMTFSGIKTEALTVPANTAYKPSEDGFFLLNGNEDIYLSLERETDAPASLSVPIYLAWQKKKGLFNVFCKCGTLSVKLPAWHKEKVPRGSNMPMSQTITVQEELDGAMPDAIAVRNRIDEIYHLLGKQDDYPFSEDLRQAIKGLKEISYSITDKTLREDIKSVLTACEEKENDLKKRAAAEAEARAREAEQAAKMAEERQQARQDSIDAAIQQKAEEDRKHNLWMIIGGVILAILLFIGNQFLQHFRNVRNQKNLMNMQESVVKRAEREAKRRARNMARSQMNRAEGEARRKTRNLINEGIGKVGKGKGNKNFSI